MTRPISLAPKFNNFPQTLTALIQWVLWCYEYKDEKWTKVPKQPNGMNASTANSATWCNFEKVCAAYQAGGYDGVGIVLTSKPLNNGLYLIGMDFDNCLANGELDDGPRKATELLDTYWEISPSGEGIRLFYLQDNPVKARKIKVDGKSREVYSTGRYLTVTGHIVGQSKEVRYVA